MKLFQVDAFTDRPFTGNPAAVCLMDGERDSEWMQLVASEMNLSETAFVSRRDDGGWDLRWFTPMVEVDLCGHATLASAHALWTEGVVGAGKPIAFHTRSGVLGATPAADGWIELDFPARPAVEGPVPQDIIQALGASPVSTGLGDVGGGFSGFLVELASEDEVRRLRPDFSGLADAFVTVTSRSSDPDFDFVSRFFGVPAGSDEDPVTGSAHCTLGPWWGERLGKDELVGYQASARGGVVRVRLRGDRALLGGQAVTVSRGELV